MRQVPGRPRDARIDARVLAAARRLLADNGYGGLTIEGVARSAGVGKQTVYRRWGRKPLLVFDAVFGGASAVTQQLPDTGTLAGDLQAVTTVQTGVYRTPGLLELLRGLVADCLTDEALLAALRARFLEPRLAALEIVVDRAATRGEISEDADRALVAQVIGGTMLFHFLLYAAEPVEGFGTRLAELVARGLR